MVILPYPLLSISSVAKPITRFAIVKSSDISSLRAACNSYLIFLQVEDQLELEMWWGELNLKNSFKSDHKKMPMSIFKEADLNNQLTAVAIYSNGTLFRKLPLMQETIISDDQ